MPYTSHYTIRRYIPNMYSFDDLLWDTIRMENTEQFVYIYSVKGFLEVDYINCSSMLRCVLVDYVIYVRVT